MGLMEEMEKKLEARAGSKLKGLTDEIHLLLEAQNETNRILKDISEIIKR